MGRGVEGREKEEREGNEKEVIIIFPTNSGGEEAHVLSEGEVIFAKRD